MIKALITSIILFSTFVSFAKIYQVTNTKSSGAGSFPQAIMDANNNTGTDTVDATGVTGTITLTGTITITDSVTINGPTSGNLTLDGGHIGFRVLRITSGTNIINYLTITRGSLPTLSHSSKGGAGIKNTGKSLTLDHCIIDNCTSNEENGTGIHSEGALNMNYCRVSKNYCYSLNSVNLEGGGIFITGSSNVVISNCLIDSNNLGGSEFVTDLAGAGIAFHSKSSETPGRLRIVNSTISSNTISSGNVVQGSGISINNLNKSAITISQSTIAYNKFDREYPSNEEYNAALYGDDVSIQSTILSNNSIVIQSKAIPNYSVNISGYVRSLGNNIIDTDFGGAHSTDRTNTDPLLLPLNNNGGFTHTHAIECSSPAIDSGVGLSFDQRDTQTLGQRRDIGAYEYRKINETPKIRIDTIIACASYKWIDGKTYTSSTNSATYDLIGDWRHCDTLVTLNLTINNVSDLSTYTSGNIIIANNSEATYKWLDCNNNFAVLPNDTSQYFIASNDGNYAVQLSENGCIDTSSCVSINTVGLIENSFTHKIQVYPNPTSEELNIKIQSNLLGSKFRIVNILGQEVKQGELTNSMSNIDVSKLPKGYYVLTIGEGNYYYKFFVE